MFKCIISDEKDEDGKPLEFFLEPSGSFIGDDIAEAGGKKEKTILNDKKFERICKLIPFLSKKIHTSTKEIESQGIAKPSEFSLEFSLGFNFEGNLFIAKSSIETQFKVQLTWKDT